MTEWNSARGETYDLTFGYRDEQAFASTVERLAADQVASGIAARNPLLWGEAAVDEASKRLGWVDLYTTSQSLVPEILELRERLTTDGVDRVVLCGMGGSSLAPEVICSAADVDLTVLDSSHPDMVHAATSERLASTVVVVSSKSGGTVETDSHRRAFEQAFRDAGIDPAARIVVVTDPGSPLEESARQAGYRVFLANPEVGGRYSALTAFGLVPSGLAGADISGLLDEAARIAPALERDDVDNPALRLGGLLGAANQQGADKLLLASAGSSFPGLGDWAEQLIAESTGKDGRGVLPVVADDLHVHDGLVGTTDEVVVTYGPVFAFDDACPTSGWGATVDAPLGAQMLLWEYATAVAGVVLGINPFDQPDVESAKKAARSMLEGEPSGDEPDVVDGSVEIRCLGGDWGADVRSLADAARALVAQLDPERGYVSVQAYLDRWTNTHQASLGLDLEQATGRPTTFGWGPRFLHSTGQYHKGGPRTGVYLQVCDVPDVDVEVPGKDYAFGRLVAAQAAGDAQVLAELGRPVLRLRLTDRQAGLAQLHGVLTGLVQTR